MKISLFDPVTIQDAAALLKQGELVAFPTETVYGLGADAGNDGAVAKIFAVKGRPSFNPLIIHVSSMEQAIGLVEWNDRAEDLASQFWPGPLTLVLPRHKNAPISLLACAGLPTVAIRVPSHPAARALLEVAGMPVAAPSANKSGHLSPTAPAHVAAEFSNEIAMIVAAGRSTVGLESTVLDLSELMPSLLRPGSVTREEIEQIIGPIDLASFVGSVKSPGLLAKHYSPNRPMRINADIVHNDEAFLDFGPGFMGQNAKARLNLSEEGDLTEAAANLFAMLHELDKPDYAAIAVAPVPEIGLGIAINDRLRRAAAL